MNYGVNPDEHHVIIDVDVKPGKLGDVHLMDIEMEPGNDPITGGATFTVGTPSGGTHLYLQAPFASANAHNFPAGIDIRGPGGYVVGPYSKLIAGMCDPKDTPGEYVVEHDATPISPPAWVIVRLKKQGEKGETTINPVFDLDTPEAVQMASDWLRNRRPAIEGQEGDKHTLLTAAGLIDLGVSDLKALELLTEPLILIDGERRSWNDTCEPPWDLADLAVKVENALKYRETRPGSKGTDTAALDEAMERAMAASGGTEAVEAEEKRVENKKLDRWEKLAYPFSRIGGIEHREMIIPDILPAQGVSAVVAKRGSGKTVMLTDLSLHVAMGKAWHGFPVEPGRKVFYLAGEDDTGTADMIKGWGIENQVEDIPNFWFLRGIIDLLDVESCESFIRWALTKIEDTDSVLLIFDTWQRATAGASQSDDVLMQKAWHHAEFIARTLRAAAVIACHPPKDDRLTIMGSSVMENNTEAIWELTPLDMVKGAKFEVTRIKGGPSGAYAQFEFKIVPLGEIDKFNRPRTGVVPIKKSGEVFVGPDALGKRTAYAMVIAELNLLRHEKRFTHSKGMPYTVNEVAKYIAGEAPRSNKKNRVIGLLELSRGTGEEAQWAKGQVDRLQEYVNLSTKPSVDAIEKDLLLLWQKAPDGHPITYVDSPVKVRLKNRGRGQVFEVETNTDMMGQADKDA
jgi:hypothetical protein